MSATLDENRIKLLNTDIEIVIKDGFMVISLLKFFGDIFLDGKKPKNDCNMWLRQYHRRLKNRFKTEINANN